MINKDLIDYIAGKAKISNTSLVEKDFIIQSLLPGLSKNNYIKAKIRQQLQILRDKGILKFKERGKYLVLKWPPPDALKGGELNPRNY